MIAARHTHVHCCGSGVPLLRSSVQLGCVGPHGSQPALFEEEYAAMLHAHQVAQQARGRTLSDSTPLQHNDSRSLRTAPYTLHTPGIYPSTRTMATRKGACVADQGEVSRKMKVAK